MGLILDMDENGIYRPFNEFERFGGKHKLYHQAHPTLPDGRPTPPALRQEVGLFWNYPSWFFSILFSVVAIGLFGVVGYFLYLISNSLSRL